MFFVIIKAAGVAAQACQVAAATRNRAGSDEEDAMHDDGDEINEQLHSSKNSISPPASSFDSTHSGIFARSPTSNNSGISGGKFKDIQPHHHDQIPNVAQTAAPSASLPLW